MRKGIALFLVLAEFFKLSVIVLTGAPIISYLPLHICSFALFSILIDAFWPQNRFFKQLMAFMYLPAAVVSLLFPTVTGYPPINFYPIHQFLVHTAIAAYIIAEYAVGEIRPRYAGVCLSLLVTALLAALIYPLNNAFQTNYIFLASHSNNPALKVVWNVTGGTGGIPYILGLGVLIIAVMHIMFVIYVVLENCAGKRSSR